MHVSRCHLPQTTYESAILRVLGGLATAMAVILMVLTFAVLAIASRFVKLRDVYGSLGDES